MKKPRKTVTKLNEHEEMVAQWMLDPKFKQEYDALEDEYQLLKEMLQARQRSGLTQLEVAQRMGTKAPAVARLEASVRPGKNSPSINTLRKYAKAVGCKLHIHIKPIRGNNLDEPR
jgi:ribosome-binding protein aMBF1 (putative translation factor)